MMDTPESPHIQEAIQPPILGESERNTALFALLAILVYIAFDLLLPLFHVHPRGLRLWEISLLVIVPTAAFMLLQVWLSRALVGLGPRPAVSAILTIASVLLWFITLTLYARYRAGVPHPAVMAVILRNLLMGLFITLACTFFGILLSRIVREPNVLLPVALIAMPIDYLGAMTKIGFTQNAVQQHPNIVQAVSVPVPAVGGLHLYPLIGPGDALFMAFFFAIVLRLGLNMRGTFWWMYGLLTIAMLLVLFTGLPIAALVPMGLAVLIANCRYFRLNRSELFAVIYAAIFIIALVTGFYAYSHAHFFRPPPSRSLK